MSESYAAETLKTIVSWARYAELFSFDEKSELFSLENPH
jgi:NitT/TauT family transport system ATP-binding protein